MAYTYSNTPVLSKIKIGANTYYLKDGDVRAILDTFNDAVVTNQIGTVEGNDGKFVTAANIKAYVDQAVSVGIEIIVDTKAQDKDEPATVASANTMGKLYFVALDDTATGTYTEFITLRSGEEDSYTYAWEKIGTTEADLSEYAKTADLGAFAFVDEGTGTGSLETVDSAAFTNGAVSASATYTPAGTITASVSGTTATATISYESYTPAGTITLDATTTAATATLTKADYTPEGTISKPDVNVTATTTTISVNKTAGTVTAGTAASFTEGAFSPNVPTALDLTKFSGGSKANDTFTQGSLPSLGAATEGSFATAGIVASIDSTDTEMLVFTAATTATAVTAQGTFSAGTLPTFQEGTYTPASLAEGFYTPGKAASKAADAFNGGTPTNVTLPTFEDATVVTGATAALASTPTFTGTKLADALVTGVSYDKTSVSGATFTGTAANIKASTITYEKANAIEATFTGTAATISSTGTATGDVELTKTDKTISVTVTPNAGE